MTIDPANLGFRILPADLPRPSSLPGPAETPSSFGDSLRNAVAQVDRLSLDAQAQVSSAVAGSGGDLHDAMIAVEKADLSFQLMLQVRNKVVQAYQQIAGMQF